MYEFHPYFTNDGSVGLYNSDYNDIYHSATGALTEAYEKFVYPIDFEWLLKKDKIKVLDICYGIGYNTKSFLNFIFENYFLKNFSKKSSHADMSIATIDTNNLNDKLLSYSEKIYSDNLFRKISVTAVDNDKILTLLSPFIKTGEKHIKNNNINFEYRAIDKFLTKNNSNLSPEINPIINFLIFDKIFNKNSENFEDLDLTKLLFSNDLSQFFDNNIRGIMACYMRTHGKVIPYRNYLSFLHNIYYNHISNKYKSTLKRYLLQDIDFNIYNDDARHYILNNCNTYNVIFLDAFTPSKCPCLWSYEFFVQLYKHLEHDGILLTYSTSASVRGAMLEAGFFIGYIKLQDNKNIIGTFASKSKSQIKFPLSEYDLGLIKTRAGIFYRDENLTGQNEAIIAARNFEIKNSDRMTSSQYKKHNSE